MLRRMLVFLAAATLAAAPPLLAQSQAINGSIEGTIKDSTGAVLPGVTLTMTNAATGTVRTVTSGPDGFYRAVLLPLGTYTVKAELNGFKTVERSGVTLTAGLTAVVNVSMSVGGVEEVVQVTAEPPVTDPGKIDLGRTITETEVKNLPNVSRNYYNLALIQPNVTGYENEEFGATRMNANGSQMRTNYQIDGSSATQKNRAGLRMFQPSEVMIKEVQVITSGFAPEFGQTTGMVFNAVSPSGTNVFHGTAGYRFRRKGLASRPFLLAPTAPKPDLKIDDFTADLGGPIQKDKWFFYLGYERDRNDLSSGRIITVTPETAQILGLSSDALGNGVIPAIQTVNMWIAKTDYQINPSNHLSARWLVFKNTTPENVGGGLNTRETAVDFQDRMDNAGLQLVSNFGTDKLNELRFAYGKRNNPRVPSAVAGTGPQVTISGVANFGGSATHTEFIEEYYQINDNFSVIKGRHAVKFGIDFQFIRDSRLADVHATYTFPTIDSYLAAKSGANPYGYTRFQQSIGDASLEYKQQYYSAFIQDDFRITPNFKLLYGIRYDLFKVPSGLADAPYAATRDFTVDKNNFGPRVGFSWSLDPEAKTVLRASTGIMYEPPLGAFYEQALQNAGTSKFLTAVVTPSQPGAPAYPGTLSSLPPGVTPSRSIYAVSPDFKTQYAILSNVQLERGLTDDLSVGVGYVNSTGRNLPTRLNANVIPTGATLPDGRPIYSRTVNASTRVDPSFDTIDEIRSTGKSQYNAFTVNLHKRMSHGYQLQASYTFANAKDDGVIGGTYVVGSTDRPGLSDPSNQSRDYSYTSWNVKHTFILSGVLEPHVSGDGAGAAIVNNNQLTFIIQANSGLPYNIRSNKDLNLDGISADRPNGVARNSGELGSFMDVSARYSRFIPLTDRVKAEVFLEAKNLFNRQNIRAVNSVVATDDLGNPLTAIPGTFATTSLYQERQFQLGVRLNF